MQHKGKQHFVCYIDFPEDVCPSHSARSSNHATEPPNYHVMLYWPIWNLREFEQLWVYSGWFLVRPKVALNTLTSSCHCLRTNLVNLSPDDHCLRGKVCGEFYSRSWRAVLGEWTFRMFAVVFITVTWLNASFSCAREPVVWEIICLPSWTKVRSCLLDGLKRIQWDVDFKNPLGNCRVPEEVKSSLHPLINIFLFIFFLIERLEGRFPGHVYVRANSLTAGMVDSIDSNVCLSCFQVHGEKCAGCKGRIMDRYLVKVSGKAWHTGCLKCCICGLELGKEATCYTKEDKIYCKTDYARFVYLRVHLLWYLCKGLCLFFGFHLLCASYSHEQDVSRTLPRDNYRKK